MEPIDPRPLDILDGEFYVDGDTYAKYAWLRETSPSCGTRRTNSGW